MQRCLGCMLEFGDEFDVCPHCGYLVGTEPAAKNHLAPGTVLQDRYTLGRVLGQGGFGITYIAWDNKIGRAVSVKEYMPSALASRMTGEREVSCYSEKAKQEFEQGLQKTRREAHALSRFNALESVVKVIDCIEENGTAYIIMELLRGRTVQQILRERGKFSFAEALRIMTPVLQTLDAMHSVGMIHRDVAPDNIFVCDDGKVKLLDFGAARVVSGTDQKTLSVMLKAGYAPIEQYSSKAKQGAYTDVYAASATIYKMLTGETPPDSFSREKDGSDLVALSQTDVPQSAKETILAGMAQDAESRIQSARELLTRLQKSAQNADGNTPEQPGPKKTKIILCIVLAAALILAAVILVFLLPKRTVDPGPREATAEIAASVTQALATETVSAADGTKLYAIGSTIRFGALDQDNEPQNGSEPIEWIVLDRTEDRLLVLSKLAIACLPYNSAAGATSWQTCSLRNWLNGVFLQTAFSPAQQQQIVTFDSPLSDAVFLLSADEATRYFASASDRMTGATQTAAADGAYRENGVCGWWLRDTGDSDAVAARVNIHGEILTGSSSEGGVERQDYAVRPCMWISTDAVSE